MSSRILLPLLFLTAGFAVAAFASGNVQREDLPQAKQARASSTRWTAWPDNADLPPMPGPAPKYRWESVENESLTLVGPWGIVWRFNFGPKLTKPHFHPLQTADGRCLTWAAPPDHPWHYGLWHSWKYIDRVNYWEEDRRTGLAGGTTRVVEAVVRRYDETGASLRLRLVYHAAEKPEDVVLEDLIEIAINMPRADGSYCIAWNQVSRARRPVVLDRTPPPGQPGGRAHGGYAGLSFRGSRFLTDFTVISSTGAVDMAGHRQPAGWVAMTASSDGRPVGLTLFDHPSNARHPTPWFLVMEKAVANRGGPFWYINAAPLSDEPIELTPARPLALSYLVRIDNDRPVVDTIETEYRQFSATRPSAPARLP
jgi:hypothetical protein